MIQRKQTIWLFLAAIANAGVFLFDLYRTHTLVNGVDTPGQIRVADRFPLVLLAVVITLLPLVTIFMFNNRKQQMRMIAYSLVAVSSFVFAMLAAVGRITPAPTTGSYWIGSVLPVASIIFLLLAFTGVRKDEKLVKSVDRFRD